MYKDILFNYVGSLFLRQKNGIRMRREEFLFYLQSIKAVKWIPVLYITKSYYQPYLLLL